VFLRNAERGRSVAGKSEKRIKNERCRRKSPRRGQTGANERARDFGAREFAPQFSKFFHQPLNPKRGTLVLGLGVWFMNGTQLSSAQLLNPTRAGGTWKIVAPK